VSETLLDAIIHGPGHGADVYAKARICVGPGGKTMRVYAQCGYGTATPTTAPRLSLERSDDGDTWETLLDLGAVADRPVTGEATLPPGGQLRAAWQWTPDDNSLYWQPRIWLEP
jgi:hypothetical protein